MNTWLVLIPYALLLALGSLFSYRQELKDSRWFLPVYVGASISCSLLWVWSVRTLGDVNRVYFLSLCIDLLMILAYYVLPLALVELRFNRWTCLGVGMMVLGLAVVKIKG